MADIFFSYAPADAGRAQAIAAALKTHGLDVAWDRTLLPGERYDAVISARLAEAKAVVVLWSAHSTASNLIIDEAAMARDQGKLIPVRIDSVESPIGFRQLQTGDLSGFPGPGSEAPLKLLADALSLSIGAEARPVAAAAVWRAPPPADSGEEAPLDATPAGRFLRTRVFVAWTGALAAFVGLLFFLSPLVSVDMGDTPAERTGFLIGLLIVMFAIMAWGRALIYLSRLLVGKPTRRYFGVEMIVIAAIAAAFALLAALNPDPDAADEAAVGRGALGLAHAFNLMFMTSMLFAPPVLLALRALRRIVAGKVKPA